MGVFAGMGAFSETDMLTNVATLLTNLGGRLKGRTLKRATE